MIVTTIEAARRRIAGQDLEQLGLATSRDLAAVSDHVDAKQRALEPS